MTPNQLTGDRGRAVKLTADFAREFLIDGRRLAPPAVVFGLIAVAAELLRLDPTDRDNLSLARDLAAALTAVVNPPATGTH